MALSSRRKEADSASSNVQALRAALETIESSLYESKDETIHKAFEAIVEKFKKAKEKKHSKKWDDCVNDVSKKGSADSPEAVCTAQLGDNSYESKESDLKSNIAWHFKESDALIIPGAIKFDVVLIEEGLGNLVDGAFYSKEALQGSSQAFEGKKIYANHPKRSEEKDRPERDVRDILGHFENVRYEEINGRGVLRGDLLLTEGVASEWAKDQILHALEFKKKYPDKEFIGLSINASGDADERPIEEAMRLASAPCLEKLQEAKDQGRDTVNYVTKIEDAISCDLVTEAGAGGKILKLLEEDKMSKKIREADDQGGDHKDEKQDKELIKKMMKKHMGDDESSDEEEAGILENYEAYKEMGHKEDDAMKMAAAHHKMEKMKASKKKEAEAKKESEEAHKECDDAKKEETHKEKAKESDVAELAGRVAFLETENRKMKLDKTIQKQLSESGLPHKATKLFLEKCGKDFKTEEEFKKVFAAFKEAFNATKTGDEGSPFVVSVDKQIFSESKSTDLSFEDCLD